MSEKIEQDNNRTILVVDDENYIVHVVSLKLKNAGYTVIAARDGEEGYHIALEEQPDLIITDYQMPYMTGIEMCEKLRQHDETSNIPIMLLTARGLSISDTDLATANIRCTITKPFSPRELLGEVQLALAG